MEETHYKSTSLHIVYGNNYWNFNSSNIEMIMCIDLYIL